MINVDRREFHLLELLLLDESESDCEFEAVVLAAVVLGLAFLTASAEAFVDPLEKSRCLLPPLMAMMSGLFISTLRDPPGAHLRDYEFATDLVIRRLLLYATLIYAAVLLVMSMAIPALRAVVVVVEVVPPVVVLDSVRRLVVDAAAVDADVVLSAMVAMMPIPSPLIPDEV